MYQPEEDSFFLSEELAKYLKSLSEKEKSKLKALDLGTGSGIQAENLIRLGIKKENILAADINEKAIEKAKKLKIKIIKSDLFSKIEDKFDLIIFNPPYLPEIKFDKEKDITGGKKGDETILSFLKQVKSHLTKKGKIFLLLSSLTPAARIRTEIEKQKLISRKIAEKKLFFELLEIWLISF